MRFDSPDSQKLVSRFGFLALATLVVTLPFAVPALWDVIAVKLGLQRGIYLLKPVENQTYYLLMGFTAAVLPYLGWRALTPPRKIPRSSIAVLAVVFLLLHAASAIGSPSPEYVFRSMLMPAVFLAALLLVQTLEFQIPEIEKLFLLAVLTTVPATIYALLQSHGVEFLPYSRVISELRQEEISGKQLISSTFGHPNYLASYLAPLAFWALYFAINRNTKTERAIGVGAFLLIIAALVVCGTRGAWIAVIGACIPYYLLLTLFPEYRRRLLFAAGMGIVLVIICLFLPIPFLKVQFKLSQRVLASKEITERLYYWMMALQMIKEHPLLGVGYHNFNMFFWDLVNNYQMRPESNYFRFILSDNIRGISPGFAHNDYLQIAAETGIGSLLVWLGVWTVLICQTWETARRFLNNRRVLLLAATFLASSVAVGLDGVFNFPLQIPVSGFLFWWMLGSWTVLHSMSFGTFVSTVPEEKKTSSIAKQFQKLKA